MDVLVYLAARPGCVVSKETLKREVWGRVHIVDAAVKRCISQIRKAFADDPARPQTIETVPKRGYQLVAPVRSDPPLRLSAAMLRGSFATIVIAVFATAAWTQVASSRPAAVSLDDLNLYDVARAQYHRYDEDGAIAAVGVYESLLETDPHDSAALAGLADTLMQQYLRGPHDEALAVRARDAAIESIRLDADRPDAYKALGAYYHFRGERHRAMALYHRAVQRDPGYWTALNNGGEILRDAGDYGAARGWFQCALAVTPRKVDVLIRLAVVEARSGSPSTAAHYLGMATLMDPDNEDASLALERLHAGELQTPAEESGASGLTIEAVRFYRDTPCDYAVMLGTIPKEQSAHTSVGTI